MTCVVGVVVGRQAWIGADSCGGGGYFARTRADQKVFETGEFLFGFTTSFRMGQVLRYRFTPPTPAEDVALERYMATVFVDAVREVLKTAGFAKVENGREEGGSFLVAWRGRLFEIGSDYQVGEVPDGFAAVGCGREPALGSLYTSKRIAGKLGPDAVRLALEAAAEFSGYVRGPYHVLEKDWRKPGRSAAPLRKKR